MSTERETLDYATYGAAVRELAQQVADDGFRPEMILAIARGGLFVAGSKVVVVFDVGGGTTDVTLVRVGLGIFTEFLIR